MPADSQTTDLVGDRRWNAWQADLVKIARLAGWLQIDPRDYRDYFDEDYTPQDAWDEDMSHAD